MNKGGNYKEGKRTGGTKPAPVRKHADKVKSAKPESQPASDTKKKKSGVDSDEI